MTKTAKVFSVNDRVSHSAYGPGTITEVNEHGTTIVFDAHGVKKFLTAVVRLEHSSTPAPPRPAPGKKAKAAKVAG